jgi:hypothetical protein
MSRLFCGEPVDWEDNFSSWEEAFPIDELNDLVGRCTETVLQGRTEPETTAEKIMILSAVFMHICPLWHAPLYYSRIKEHPMFASINKNEARVVSIITASKLDDCLICPALHKKLADNWVKNMVAVTTMN